eukprot:scaffold1165_cov323-Prasinococcus_capsulatus_cf.AAC.2
MATELTMTMMIMRADHLTSPADNITYAIPTTNDTPNNSNAEARSQTSATAERSHPRVHPRHRPSHRRAATVQSEPSCALRITLSEEAEDGRFASLGVTAIKHPRVGQGGVFVRQELDTWGDPLVAVNSQTRLSGCCDSSAIPSELPPLPELSGDEIHPTRSTFDGGRAARGPSPWAARGRNGHRKARAPSGGAAADRLAERWLFLRRSLRVASTAAPASRARRLAGLRRRERGKTEHAE